MKFKKDYLELYPYDIKEENQHYIYNIRYGDFDSGYIIRVGFFVNVNEILENYKCVKIKNRFDLSYKVLTPSDNGKYFLDFEESNGDKPLHPYNKFNWLRECEFIIYDGISWIRWGIYKKIWEQSFENEKNYLQNNSQNNCNCCNPSCY